MCVACVCVARVCVRDVLPTHCLPQEKERKAEAELRQQYEDKRRQQQAELDAEKKEALSKLNKLKRKRPGWPFASAKAARF